MTFGVRVWGSTSYKAGTAKDTVKSLKFARYKFHMIVFADISLQSSFFFMTHQHSIGHTVPRKYLEVS